MTVAANFPAAVRTIRSMHRLSQGELLEALGHSQSWCSRVERGEREPSLSDLALLSHLFGLELTRGDWHVRPARSHESTKERHAIRA